MINSAEFKQIKEAVFGVLNFEFAGDITPVECPGEAYVKIEKNNAFIGASDKSLCARSFMLLAQNAGNDVEIKQSPAFTMRGVMIDVSRGGAMRIDAIKKYISYMACMGLNSVWLYMEDMYEVVEYPHFGYMRGRYSAQELKELDKYALSLGIEVIPCIQTLSHLEKYMRWEEAKDIRATGTTMLCDEEKTYEFIETLIKTVSEIFSSRRIHIGMDEAHDFLEGEYKKRHGEANGFEVLTRHLNRVTKICEKYNLKPMMWDDMFFKLGSKTKDYYDVNSVVPAEVKDAIPNIDLVYWDYDRTDENRYVKLIEQHKTMGKNVIYAGGLWTWVTGQIPNTYNVFNTLWKGINAAAKTELHEVVATMWGDDGTECNYFLTLPYLSIISEPCFNTKCTIKDLKKTAEFVTGVKFEAMDALSAYHIPHREGDCCVDYIGRGKRIFYADLLYNQTAQITKLKEYIPGYRESKEILKKCAAESSDMWTDFYKYAADIFDILETKVTVMHEIRNEYITGNKEYFKILANETLPKMIKKYKSVYEMLEKSWMQTYKVFGWEIISKRYAMVIDRTEYINRVISNYAEGLSDKIEELEFDYIEEEINNVEILYGSYI